MSDYSGSTLGEDMTWKWTEPEKERSEYQYEELVSQPYLNCKFSAGFVTGHPVDSLYLKLERNNEENLIVLLRPDEMAAIAYCASGALWSSCMNELDNKENRNEKII